MSHPILPLQPLRPLHDRILVARPKAKLEVTRGGIYIPEIATRRANEGIVVAVGAGAWLKNGERSSMGVKPGDHVMFGKYAEQDVKALGLSEGEFAMMRESDVLCVLD